MTQTKNPWYNVFGSTGRLIGGGGAQAGPGLQSIATTTTQPPFGQQWGVTYPPHQPTARNAADRMVDRMEKAEAVRSGEAIARIGRFRRLCERYAAEKLSELFAEEPHDPLTAEEESELKALAAATLLAEGPVDQDVAAMDVSYGPALVKAY